MNESPEAAFVRLYIECALWSSSDNTPDDRDAINPPNMGDWATEADIDMESLATMKLEAMAFYQAHKDVIPDEMAEDAGMMFWLNRNGHGSGFWDSPDVWGEATERLNNAAHAAGERNLYVGDDWRIYQR